MNKFSVKGFTLIELLVVISIIGVLAGMGIAGAPMIMNRAKKTKAKSVINGLQMALARYKNDYGVYPNDESPVTVMNDLTGYKDSPDKPDEIYLNDPDWKGPYFKIEIKDADRGQRNRALLDPWKSPYQFNLSDPKYNAFSCDIYSFGPNGEDDKGKKDDVTNWR